jgi:hypothetical protein
MLCLVACSKTTQISGVVTSIRTGEPLADIQIFFLGYKGKIQDSNQSIVASQKIVETDENGNYAVELSGKFDDISVGLTYYCSKYFDVTNIDDIEQGEQNIRNIGLDMADGDLKIILTNTSGATTSNLDIRVLCTGNNEVAGCCSTSSKFSSVLGQVDTLSRFIVSPERYVKVTWVDKSKNINHLDSVFCPAGGVGYLNLAY